MPDLRNADADDVQQTIILPSGSRVCSYALGNGVSQRSTTSTCQNILEIVGPNSTATYPDDMQTAQGMVKCVGDVNAAGGEMFHVKGKKGEGETRGPGGGEMFHNI